MFYWINELLPPPPLNALALKAIDPARANHNKHIISSKTYTRTTWDGRKYEFTYHARKGWRRRRIG